MKKRDKIIYWIATLWLALGLISTGIVQVLKTEQEVERMTRLGFPTYSLTILGTWKILGVIAMLIPKFPRLKEWAYAGVFFNMTGALFSHVVSGSSVNEMIGPLLFLVLIGVSWYFRPADRKMMTA